MVVMDEPDNRPELTPALLMYDEFESYQSLLALFSLMAYNGLAPHITANTSGNVNATSAVKGLFEIYAHKNMSDEQAKGFAPFFILMVFNKLSDDGERDNQTEELNALYESKDFWDTAGAMFDHYVSIEPYLIKEYDKLHKLDNAITLNDLKALIFPYRDLPEDELERLFEICKSGERVWHGAHGTYSALNEHFENIYKAVKAARQALEDKEKTVKPKKKKQAIAPAMPIVTPYLPERLFIAKDIVTKKLLLDRNFKYGKKTAIKAVNEDKINDGTYKTMPYITMLVNWNDDDNILQEINGFDRDVYFAVCNLYWVGQDNYTYNQIARTMGYRSNVGKVYREKLINSLLKLATTWVLIDNSNEVKVFKEREPVKKYAPLLQISFVEFFVKGQLTQGIEINDEPHLFAFAYERGNFATVPIKALECQASKSNMTSDIQYYLVTHISWLNNLAAKRKPYNPQLKLSTIWDNCHITTRKQQTQQKAKLKDILEPFKTSNYIKGYEIDDDYITIHPNKEYANEETSQNKKNKK